jgi:hypothetical protein
MNDDEYYIPEDDDDQAAADLAEYEQYVHEQNRKSRSLLAHPDALALARPFAEDLTRLVQQHAKPDGMTTLLEVIRDSLCEDVFVVKAFEGHTALLEQTFNRAGYLAIRQSLDAACSAFAALLAAEEGLLPIESGAK